jgi:DNA-binding transcriptional LysR family regulator
MSANRRYHKRSPLSNASWVWQLLVRRSSGVQTTRAGITRRAEARDILARHDRMLPTISAAATDTRVVQLGIRLELAPDLLRAVARFAAEHPCTRVIPRPVDGRTTR